MHKPLHKPLLFYVFLIVISLKSHFPAHCFAVLHLHGTIVHSLVLSIPYHRIIPPHRGNINNVIMDLRSSVNELEIQMEKQISSLRTHVDRLTSDTDADVEQLVEKIN